MLIVTTQQMGGLSPANKKPINEKIVSILRFHVPRPEKDYTIQLFFICLDPFEMTAVLFLALLGGHE